VLISQYIPIVPKYIADLQLFGYQLNKFGYTLLAVLFFYLIKSTLGFLFYQSIGDGKNGLFFIYLHQILFYSVFFADNSVRNPLLLPNRQK
jgi:hypothetical protein